MRISWILCLGTLAGFGANALQPQDTTTGVAIEKRSATANVSWDEYSWIIDGERLVVLSGEFHSWRLPNPSLWLDIFQKVKALGFNAISTYINWGLVEATNGTFRFDGIFDYDPFFQAAKDSGVYAILRAGPYINAECSAGGFPGWRFHAPEGIYWRVQNQSYYDEIYNYVHTVGEMFAPYQLGQNGTIILLQLENELSTAAVAGTVFPAEEYMVFLNDAFRDAGLTVPTFHNDVSHNGIYAGDAVPDVYAYDEYPLTCYPVESSISQADWTKYLEFSSDPPTEPHMIAEFGGGYYDSPGGPGYDNCDTLLNPYISELYYKNLAAMSVTSLNLYMIFGGTSWGHLGWDYVYTSYDYRAAISEDRSIIREKYASMKLRSQFLKSSSSFATTRLKTFSTSNFTNTSDIVVTQTPDDLSNTTFWFTRHTAINNVSNITYTLTLPTSQGNLTIPQLGGSLSITGYDSKIHVTDYSFGNHTILYSTAEILSWQTFDSNHVIVVYGSTGERHETAFLYSNGACEVIEGSINLCNTSDSTTTLNYITSGQSVVRIGSDITLYIVDRATAYQFWFPNLPTGTTLASISNETVIVKGPYLVRSAEVSDGTLDLVGDLNVSTSLEVYASSDVTGVSWNGNQVITTKTSAGSLIGNLTFDEPSISLPDLTALTWRSHDSILELYNDYDDSLWVDANRTSSPNGARAFTTPTDLYAGDYGFHVGALLYRGHFTATGSETALNLTVSGGNAFGFSAWINGTYLGSYIGAVGTEDTRQVFSINETLSPNQPYVIIVLTENMGYNENDNGGITYPRGILDYSFTGASPSVQWKLTGNLGGEDYADLVRGPMNEGGFLAERMGWHQPNPPSDSWSLKTPLQGVSTPGVEIFVANFTLDLPEGYDIPLAITLEGTADLRAHIYVNGYKFGRYTQNIGPQTVFPVPEGIINHRGGNSIAFIHWNLASDGGSLVQLSLNSTGVYQTGYGAISAVLQPAYSARAGAY